MIKTVFNKLSADMFIFGLQGFISVIVPYHITAYFTNDTDALISGMLGLFMFTEHKNFGFKRRTAYSLLIVGVQIILLISLSVVFAQHYYWAIPFHFILFLSLNYYNYYDTPNTIKIFPILYFYIISITTPIEIVQLPDRILGIIIGITFSAVTLLWVWPTKTHKNIELLLSSYLNNICQMLKDDIAVYNQKSEEYNNSQNNLYSDIMNMLYGLKYGEIFSTTKGKYLFKIAVNSQILNNTLSHLRRLGQVHEISTSVEFAEVVDVWKTEFYKIIKLLKKTVVEDKHTLLKLEDQYKTFNYASLKLINDLEGFERERRSVTEIKYLVGTLIDFSKRLILYRHKTETVKERNKLDFLYNFDNFRHNILKSLSFKLPSFRFAFQMSMLLTISLFLVAHFDIFEGFWIPMTISVILKPNHGGTKNQTIARIKGTLIGLVLAFLVIIISPSNIVVYGVILLSVWLAITSIKLDYAWVVVFITSSVVLLMSIKYDANEIFLIRFLFTVSTAIIVLITNLLVFPNWSKNEVRSRLINTLKIDGLIINSILKKANNERINKDDVRLNMLNSYQGRKQITDLYIKMSAEPKNQQLNTNLGRQFLIAHERFSQNISRFVFAILTSKTIVKLPYNYVNSVLTTALEGIIFNLEHRGNQSKGNEEELLMLYRRLIEYETSFDLKHDQLLLIDDLKRITKRLLELGKISDNKELVFVENKVAV
ncbi:MAG: FUSC family protein [Ichthyobacteriaceae bacterium]|nr:FUSC family protein [Ichthyobacteriaceae bacterium]